MPFARCLAAIGLTLAAGLLVAGCVAPRPVETPVDPPEAFAFSGEAPPPARWWTAFGDPALTAAIDTALGANFELRGAWARLEADRAVARREAGARWPALEGFAQADVGLAGEAGGGVDDTDLGLAAAYEVDLWGRIRAAARAERLRAEATAEDVEATALALSAEIARTWFALAHARSERALVEEQVATNATVLALIENRFGVGLARAVDVLRQRQRVEASRGQLADVAARLSVLAHRLSVLLGAPPRADVAAPEAVLPRLPPLPAAGIPLDLVRRRPDVRAAFLRLRAADHDLAAAVAARYPRLSLSATAAGGVDDLFGGWAASLAGGVLAPVFYGGALRAEAARADAVREELLYAYAQATLVAFREVEDALVLEARQRERLAHLGAQIELARAAYDQLLVQYLNGASTYLEVLTALDDLQALGRTRLEARLTLVEYRIALYRALAGPLDLPAPDA